mmetsp:Transcript_28811/g.73006  ORF Transcript_28811/g.73006 Transcript_28811/m.73006 type:complete len:210 (+) Transcript_28811:93-722(+)
MTAVALTWADRGLPFNPRAPAFTPFADVKLRAEAAEFVPTWDGADVWHHVAEASWDYKHKRQMPSATDDEWAMRFVKREKEIETIKSLQSYRLYLESLPRDLRSYEDPRTPRAHDRTLSKRMWKWNVEKWRLQIKSRCAYSRTTMLECKEYLLRAGEIDEGAARACRIRAGEIDEDAARARRIPANAEEQRLDAAAVTLTQAAPEVGKL